MSQKQTLTLGTWTFPNEPGIEYPVSLTIDPARLGHTVRKAKKNQKGKTTLAGGGLVIRLGPANVVPGG